MTTLVIDASVLVAAAHSSDRHYDAAFRFLQSCSRSDVTLAVPALARVEVACAITPRTGNPAATLELVTALFGDRRISEHALDASLAALAAHTGSRVGLRGADACYVALALRLDCPLITVDGELIDRGGGVSPDVWLRLREPGGEAG